MTTKYAALLALAAMAAAGPVHAGGNAPRAGETKTDEGKAGRVFISPAGEPFRDAGPGQDPESAWFAGADSDGDGRLAPAELVADGSRFFALLDSDGDGEIGAAEIGHYENAVAPEIRTADAAGARADAGRGESRGDSRSGGTPNDHGGGKPGEGAKSGGRSGGAAPAPGPRSASSGPYTPQGGAGQFAYLNIPEPVLAADTDWNRRIAPSEFEAAAVLRFGLLDADGDGFLTLEELPTPGRRPRK